MPLVLAVVQAVVSALIGPVVFSIGQRAFGPPTAALAGVLATLHPGLLAYTWKLHPLGIDVVLLALLVWWANRERWNTRSTLMTGLALGLNLMTRPTFFMAGVVGLGYRWLSRPGAGAPALAVLATALVIAAPWVGRNWFDLGHPLVSSTAFEDVWKGNNPMANGSSLLAPDEDIFEAAPLALRDRLAAADELQANDIFARESVTFILDRPGQFAALFAQKLAAFWWLPPRAGLLYPPAWLVAYKVYAAVIFVLAASGGLAILRSGSASQRDLLATLVIMSMTLAAIHALTYVEGRHRWGIEPLLLLLTARGVSAVVGALPGLAVWDQWRVLWRSSASKLSPRNTSSSAE
jgi:hypothetical protein